MVDGRSYNLENILNEINDENEDSSYRYSLRHESSLK